MQIQSYANIIQITILLWDSHFFGKIFSIRNYFGNKDVHKHRYSSTCWVVAFASMIVAFSIARIFSWQLGTILLKILVSRRKITFSEWMLWHCAKLFPRQSESTSKDVLVFTFKTSDIWMGHSLKLFNSDWSCGWLSIRELSGNLGRYKLLIYIILKLLNY